jgi:abortive infection bacteriophage resistance protein
MIYLRKKHGINIEGSIQKRKLRNYGYYHGYKGYRFIKKASNKINFSDFNQLCSIIEFDNEMKALFYPQVMFIETSLKNYALEIILKNSKTDNFNYIFSNQLVSYKSHKVNSEDYKNEMRKRLNLQSLIYNTLAKNYKNKKDVIVHFYNKNGSVPIWAIFEVISLGDFGTFISCLEEKIRKDISKELNFNTGCDPNGRLLEKIIFCLKELRNSFSHNDIIFDARFKESNISKNIISCLEIDTKITGITFISLVDYLILIIYILKSLRYSKTDLKRIILDFEKGCEKLRIIIPINIYNQIIPTDVKNKLIKLKQFI